MHPLPCAWILAAESAFSVAGDRTAVESVTYLIGTPLQNPINLFTRSTEKVELPRAMHLTPPYIGDGAVLQNMHLINSILLVVVSTAFFAGRSRFGNVVQYTNTRTD